MSPRQIQEAFRVMGQTAAVSEEKDAGKLRWAYTTGTIAMSVFKVRAPDIYQQLGDGRLDAKEAHGFLSSALGNQDSHVNWWFDILLTGGGIAGASDERMGARQFYPIAKSVGVIDEDMSENSGHYGEFYGAWGDRFGKNLGLIRKKIESLNNWK